MPWCQYCKHNFDRYYASQADDKFIQGLWEASVNYFYNNSDIGEFIMIFLMHLIAVHWKMPPGRSANINKKKNLERIQKNNPMAVVLKTLQKWTRRIWTHN